MNSNVKTVVFWLVIVISAYLLWQTVKSGSDQKTSATSYSEFLSEVEAGKVKTVTISRTQITGLHTDGTSFRLVGPTSQDGLLQTLHEKNVEIWFRDTPESSASTWLLNLAPLILLAALWFFMIRQMKQRLVQKQTNIQV